MAASATKKSVISSESEIQMHRVVYNWDIKNFDRISTPGSEDFEPVSSSTFRAGEDIGRESEWELILSAENGYLQVWLYLKRLLDESCTSREIPVHLIVAVLQANGNQLIRRRCDKNQTFSPEDNGWGMGYIVTLETIWEQRDIYLADNTLRLRIQLDLLGDFISKTKEAVCVPVTGIKRKRCDSESDSEETDSRLVMKNDMKRLLMSEEGADFTIECEKRKFFVHKILLSARSHVFSAMFNHDTIETRSDYVKIKDINSPTMEKILEYIYTGDVNIPEGFEATINLLQAADKYELLPLKNRCFKSLCSKVTFDSAGKVSIAVYMYNAEYDVAKAVRGYCRNNWDALLKKKSFKDCLIECPKAFFQDLKSPKSEASACVSMKHSPSH